MLLRAGAIELRTRLTVDLDWFSARDQVPLRRLIDDDPSWGGDHLDGRGEPGPCGAGAVERRAVSINVHHHIMRTAAGLNAQAGATHAWKVGDTGLSVREMADRIATGQPINDAPES